MGVVVGVCVCISIVTDAITVGVQPLSGVERERICDLIRPITVNIGVSVITDAIYV